MEIYIAKSGRESGPFTQDQIKPMLESGMLDSTDAIWHEGLVDWIPVYRFLGLRPPIPVGKKPPVSVRLKESRKNNFRAKFGPDRTRWPLRERTMGRVIFLNIITLGIYGIYLVAYYSPEVEKITGRKRLGFYTMLSISIMTIGLFAEIYLCVLAYKLWTHSEDLNLPDRRKKLALHVWYLIFFSFFGGLGTGGLALPISILTYIYAILLVQREINMYAAIEAKEVHAKMREESGPMVQGGDPEPGLDKGFSNMLEKIL